MKITSASTNYFFFALFFCSFILVNSGSIYGQNTITFEQKSFTVKRTVMPPRIDGNNDDKQWKEANPVSDFIMYSPFNGVKPRFNTEVRVLYDDMALYICATMYDPAPDSIFTQLGQRDADRNLNADYFSVQLSSFNDGINGEVFKVSASNVQSDTKERGNSSDYDSHDEGGDWDAVWESRTAITAFGWVCEMRIPFSALRFSTDKNQVWGINFWREVRRVREVSSWSYVDKSTGATINHLGEMNGFADVKPPLRLSLVPYLSGYIEKSSDVEGVRTTYNGGMDLKLGLNESFTLDATLIPDFGQVQSDDHVLNLTPYETKYNENRSFFTEGTELFSRGNIFYSRRIGGTPRLAENISDKLIINEIVDNNPTEVSLINATKISGRTRNGLGIGFFNALTSPVYATLRDTLLGEKREVISEPFTNYNMIVFDQSLRNNSFISLANTNVWRAARKDRYFYTADVTSLQSVIQSKSRLYSFSGTVSLSQKYYNELKSDIGKSYNMSIGKTGGNLRIEYDFDLLSDNYDPNDMGYLDRNNEIEQRLTVSYNTFEPVGHFLTTRSSLSYENSRLFKPSAFSSENIEAELFLVFMNYWSLNFALVYLPRGEYDYFEPRTSDFSYFYHTSREIGLSLAYDTDMSKKLYLNGHFSFGSIESDLPRYSYCFYLAPLYKVSDKISLSFSYHQSYRNNDIGYVSTINPGNIVFGRRGVRSIETTLSGAYNFSASSNLTLRCRHYWSRADYDGSYFLLQKDGSLSETTFADNSDRNINFLNIDMVYSWRFAPGSELSIVWKNAIAGYSDEIINDSFRNFDEMLHLAKTNSISLKILYYLDYQNLMKVFSFK